MSKLDLTQLHIYLQILFFFYEIVIGGNLNKVAILRRESPGIPGEKQYVYVGLYQTRISVLFPEIRLYFSVIVFILLYILNRFSGLRAYASLFFRDRHVTFVHKQRFNCSDKLRKESWNI